MLSGIHGIDLFIKTNKESKMVNITDDSLQFYLMEGIGVLKCLRNEK